MKRIVPYRWLRILIWALLILAIIWTVIWIAASRWLDNKVVDITTSLNDRGTAIECANRNVSGFPFSMKLNCDQVSIVTVRGTERVDVGALSTGAHILSPDVITMQIKSPLLTYVGGKEFRAEWSRLLTKVDASIQGGFDEFETRGSHLSLSRDGIKATAKSFLTRLRPVHWTKKSEAGNSSLSFQLSTKQFGLQSATGNEIPPVAIRGVAVLKDGYLDLIQRGLSLQTVMSDGANIRLANLIVSLEGGGHLGFSGPIQVSKNGLITGKVRMGIAEPKAIGEWASRIDPTFEQAVAGLAQATAGMGKTSKLGGHEMKTISVTIKRGEVRLGFIKLGEIPPLKFD